MAADLYCAEQIAIPPEFPDILKRFTKDAIRAQPKDLVSWAAECVVGRFCVCFVCVCVCVCVCVGVCVCVCVCVCV
jgi:hypothetical protein